MVNQKQTPLSEKELCEKLLARHKESRVKLKELAIDLASLMMAYSRSTENEKMQSQRKSHALTALVENFTWHTAVVEFIETLSLFQENSSKNKTTLKQQLQNRHAALSRNIESEARDSAGEHLKIQQVCVQGRDTGGIVGLGEKVRSRLANMHARAMKDIAVIGYIQSLGIVSRTTNRTDL